MAKTNPTHFLRYTDGNKSGELFVRRILDTNIIRITGKCGEHYDMPAEDAGRFATDLLAIVKDVTWDQLEPERKDELIRTALVEYLMQTEAA